MTHELSNHDRFCGSTDWQRYAGSLCALLLSLLVVGLPFETRHQVAFLSPLQWLFLAVVVAASPLMFRYRQDLLALPLVRAAAVFVAVQWLAAAFSGDLRVNAVKAALRYSAGATLLCIALLLGNSPRWFRLWTAGAVAAALYGLLDYSGHGFPGLFRIREFYFQDVHRLSGSFEYPNTAAAYFALSLPIVWSTIRSTTWRLVAIVPIWLALILTFSRGAIAAAAAVFVVWAVVRRHTGLIPVLAAGAAVYLVLGWLHPVLFERFTAEKLRPSHGADYQLRFNKVRESTGGQAELPLTIRNTGRDSWISSGEDPVRVSYHWYDPINRIMVDVPRISTALPRDVAANESVTVDAKFQTPRLPGHYLLVWDLQYENSGWFSLDGVLPAIVEADIETGASPAREVGDMGRWYRGTRDARPVAAADVSRASLWKAALRIAEAHPLLGIGPDNFRLNYGSVLGFASWDSNIHSNNLYLETLTGSGLMGLAALVFLIARIPWSWKPSLAAAAVGLIHGLVDFFLMTTPIYFAIWLLIGWGGADADENRL